jgi:hypothetical protein
LAIEDDWSSDWLAECINIRELLAKIRRLEFNGLASGPLHPPRKSLVQFDPVMPTQQHEFLCIRGCTRCAEAVEARQDKGTPSKGLDSGQFRKLTCCANSTTKLIPDWAIGPHRSAVVLEVGHRVRMLRSSSQLKRMRPSDRADLVVNQQHGRVFGSESILVHV